MFASHVAKNLTNHTHTVEARSTTIAICKNINNIHAKQKQAKNTAKLKKPVKTDRYYS